RKPASALVENGWMGRHAVVSSGSAPAIVKLTRLRWRRDREFDRPSCGLPVAPPRRAKHSHPPGGWRCCHGVGRCRRTEHYLNGRKTHGAGQGGPTRTCRACACAHVSLGGSWAVFPRG
uniref:Uncharacterized protein n=1 Tax=Oryza brachyantha TaxID=4533 RepID=J3M7Q4_ORYBR